jgi:hypothetical protein
MRQSSGKSGSATIASPTAVMVRFAAIRHQRMLAKDMSAAANKIVKLRNRAQWNKRDPAELHAEELATREKFGLLEDTKLYDTTRQRATPSRHAETTRRCAGCRNAIQ